MQSMNLIIILFHVVMVPDMLLDLNKLKASLSWTPMKLLLSNLLSFFLYKMIGRQDWLEKMSNESAY